MKAKAHWAEDHGFAWSSVMDHMIQIPARARPTSRSWKAGPPEDEYRPYGWEFSPRPPTRIRRMEEAVSLMPKIWTKPRTTFQGRSFHVEGATLEPKPVQKPRPPVSIAGGGSR